MIGKSTFRSLTFEHFDLVLFVIGCVMWLPFRLASRLFRSAWAWAANFGLVQWYGILFVTGGAMWLLFRFGSRLLRSAWAWAANFFLKHFYYPHLYRRARWASLVIRA
jgi:hypothetical protein